MSESPRPASVTFRRLFISTDAELRDVVHELPRDDAIAVDVEMGQRVKRLPGGRQEWSHILALVQLATGGLSLVIDPLRCSLLPLAPVMRGKTRKVFLAGGQDVPLLARAGIEPIHIIDVGEIAYALFGRREDGMAALASRIFGLSLDKSVRRADWMVRPLNPTLLSYAHRDAELTLEIYRWFKEKHPEISADYTRERFEPGLSESSPEWLRRAVASGSADVMSLVADAGLDPARDTAELSAAIAPLLDQPPSPRILNRLLRLAADLGLAELLPAIALYAGSPSSIVRASVARATGRLAVAEEGEDLLRSLAEDSIEDVRRAVEAARRDLARPSVGKIEEQVGEEDSVLSGDAMAVLRRLRAQMEEGEVLARRGIAGNRTGEREPGQ